MNVEVEGNSKSGIQGLVAMVARRRHSSEPSASTSSAYIGILVHSLVFG